MRCVKETLPPRARERWLLMTIRLSQRSLTGTERTEVAVGTVRDSSMLATVRAGAPRRTVYVGWSPDPAGSAAGFGVGREVTLGAGFGSAFDTGAGATVFERGGAAAGTAVPAVVAAVVAAVVDAAFGVAVGAAVG